MEQVIGISLAIVFLSSIAFWTIYSYPASDYQSLCDTVNKPYKITLERGQKTTSLATAIKTLREQQAPSPHQINDYLDSTYHDFKSRYPKRCKNIELHSVRIDDFSYTIVLQSSTGSSITTHNIFWNDLTRFDPQRERKLVTKSVRDQLLENSGLTCRYCGYKGRGDGDLQIDHIYPVSRGGKTEMSNLQVLCANCNMSKGSKVGYAI